MATIVDELRETAHDLYARARSSIDPSTQRMLMKAADGYLRRAEEMRTGRAVIRAEFPTLDWKSVETSGVNVRYWH
jgi:Holliday junction resolvase-like predicted endonuclease